MRAFVAVPVAIILLAVPVCLPAQGVREPAAARGSAARWGGHTTRLGKAMHWCMFNRPCNWTSHATIALGITYGLDRLNVRPEVAAGAAALVFVGKEVRDHLKWGNVLGSRDSMGDLVAGLIGAGAGYMLFRRPHAPPFVDISQAEESTIVTFRLPL